MYFLRVTRRWCCGLLLVPAACARDAPGPSETAAVSNSSFAQLQIHVFNKQCVACHARAGLAFSESGLSLEPKFAHASLVNIDPRYPHARALGMKRVHPGDPMRSLLFHKLDWNSEHSEHVGNPMPLGSEPLSVGQVQFVKQWILAGAPERGLVADSMLLHDASKQVVDSFKPLPAPASGYQLRIEPFEIPPNFERELFVYRAIGNPSDIYVNRVQSRMRRGSHHFLVLQFKRNTPDILLPQHDVIRDIRARDGSMIYSNMAAMNWQTYFAGAATGAEDKQLPPGVALHLPANASLDLNSHYVNRGPYPITGEVYVNVYTVPVAEVRQTAQAFTFMDDTFELPPGQRTTLTRTFTFDRQVNVIMLTSHNHEMGEKFVIRIAGGPRDGEVVYESIDWKHPAVEWYEPPLRLAAGEGLTSIVTYHNRTDRILRHGLTSLDEMNVMRGYLY